MFGELLVLVVVDGIFAFGGIMGQVCEASGVWLSLLPNLELYSFTTNMNAMQRRAGLVIYRFLTAPTDDEKSTRQQEQEQK